MIVRYHNEDRGWEIRSEAGPMGQFQAIATMPTGEGMPKTQIWAAMTDRDAIVRLKTYVIGRAVEVYMPRPVFEQWVESLGYVVARRCPDCYHHQALHDEGCGARGCECALSYEDDGVRHVSMTRTEART